MTEQQVGSLIAFCWATITAAIVTILAFAKPKEERVKKWKRFLEDDSYFYGFLFGDFPRIFPYALFSIVGFAVCEWAYGYSHSLIIPALSGLLTILMGGVAIYYYNFK